MADLYRACTHFLSFMGVAFIVLGTFTSMAVIYESFIERLKVEIKDAGLETYRQISAGIDSRRKKKEGN